MTAIVTKSDNCPVCGGFRWYSPSGLCVKCVRKEATERNREKMAQRNVVKIGLFDISQLRTPEFKNAERRVFAGVKYQNVDWIYD